MRRPSATANATSEEATAANSADAKFTRSATEPIGIIDARWVRSTYRGKPGACAIPRYLAATISSPLSTSVTVGASVATYTPSERKNTMAAQMNRALRGDVDLSVAAAETVGAPPVPELRPVETVRVWRPFEVIM